MDAGLLRAVTRSLISIQKRSALQRLVCFLQALLLLAFGGGVAAAANSAGAGQSTVVVTNPDPELFHRYWYPNGAEISRFRLQQARYGEVHEGDAVMVYVTEAMNPELQVKADRPGPQDIPVLKLNHTRKFFTGIYPYSILSSIFDRAEPGRSSPTLKVSTSVQEWCGHVYLQLNLEGARYRVRSHSYFEQEADRDFTLEASALEDGLWTQLRIAPADLPQGPVRIIVSSLYSRLTHQPMAVRQATATLAPGAGESLEGNPLLVYTLTYPAEKRTVKIFFEKTFPYRIQRWEERYPGLNGRMAVTRAERTHTIMIDYWNHHRNPDRALLQDLGLSGPEMEPETSSE